MHSFALSRSLIHSCSHTSMANMNESFTIWITRILAKYCRIHRWAHTQSAFCYRYRCSVAMAMAMAVDVSDERSRVYAFVFVDGWCWMQSMSCQAIYTIYAYRISNFLRTSEQRENHKIFIFILLGNENCKLQRLQWLRHHSSTNNTKLVFGQEFTESVGSNNADICSLQNENKFSLLLFKQKLFSLCEWWISRCIPSLHC